MNWEEVQEYIELHYDTECLKRVYIAGEGAAWIRSGCKVLGKSRFVLDKFHMMKYVNISVAHLLDSADEVKEERVEQELKREVQEKQEGWRYQERLQGQIPGLEQHSIKWLHVC